MENQLTAAAVHLERSEHRSNLGTSRMGDKFDAMSLTNSINFGLGGLQKSINRKDYLSPALTKQQNGLMSGYLESSVQKLTSAGLRARNNASGQRMLKASVSHAELNHSTQNLYKHKN